MVGCRRRLIPYALVAMTLSPLATRPADAAERVETRLVLDRASVEPSFFPGLNKVRLFITAVTLEGGQIALDTGQPLLFRIGTAKRRIPYLVSRFEDSPIELVVAVVLQVSKAYEADFPAISESVSRSLRSWPRDSRGILVRYGTSVTADKRPHNIRSIAAAIGDTKSELDTGPTALLEAVDAAITALSPIGTAGLAPRKVIVVVSDGIDGSAQPEEFRKAGDRARRADVRIHTIGYSPIDNRRPLLALGELSKRSRGTFRWVRSLEGFDGQLRALATELTNQFVVTLFLKAGEIDGDRIAVELGDLASESLALGEPSCAGKPCAMPSSCIAGRCIERRASSGVLRWLTLVGIAMGGLVILLVIVSMVRRPPRHPLHTTDAPQDPRVLPQGAKQAGYAASANAPRAARSAYLALHTPQGQRRYPVSHGFRIGSGKRCNLRLSDPAVSRVHAELASTKGGGYLIIDRGSSNGTFVNGTRIQQMQLGHGARIRIGSSEIVFLFE